MSKYDELLITAKKDLGYTESPKNSNRTKYGEWYGYNGVPWCMQFVQYIHDKIGCRLPYKSASCSALLSWYKSNKPSCVKKEAKPGYIVIYTFGHTGIVESVTKDTITAIEGNTSATDAGSQDNGGGVFRRTRKTSLVEAFIDGINIPDPPKPEPKPETKPEVKPKEEDTMTDKEVYEAFNRYAQSLPLKLGKGTKAEFDEAVALGLTDGTNPNVPTPLWRAAIIALRALKKAK